MSRVFAVQQPAFRNAFGDWESKYDLSPAAHFGEIVLVLPPGNIPKQLEVTVTRIRAVLGDYTDADYILPIGDPIAIGLATAIACHVNKGRVNILKWDRFRQEYWAYSGNAW